MSSTPRRIAEAFSGHRFAEAYPALADDVRWDLVGVGVARDRVDGQVGHVSSCDVYEFRGDELVAIRSYTVEV